MVDDGSVKSVVDMLVRRGGYIDNGTLENELEQLFPSEERDGQCPDGLHDAFCVATMFLRQAGYIETRRCCGYALPEVAEQIW